MRKGGPTPKPTALRLLHGDRKDRINTDEPKPTQGHPECPADASDEVRAIWDYTLNQLIVMDIATMADRDALLCYCNAVVNHRKASALLAKSPVLIQGHRGVLIRNPAFVLQRDSAQVIRQFAHEFGLTPSARSDIRATSARQSTGGAERYMTG